MKTFRDLKTTIIPSIRARAISGATHHYESEAPPQQWGEIVDLHTALTTRYEGEPLHQAVQIPGLSAGDKHPRVSQRWAYQTYKDTPQSLMACFDCVWLDLDFGPKKEEGKWHERDPDGPASRALMDIVYRLRGEFGFGFHLSKSGARLVGLLAEPLTVDIYQEWYLRFIDHLGQLGYPTDRASGPYGHHIDRQCYDLSRVFYLPLIDGSHPDQVPEWIEPTFEKELDFDPGPILSWQGISTGSTSYSVTLTDPPRDPREFTKTALRANIGKKTYYDRLTQPHPIAAPGDRHPEMQSIAASLAAMGYTDAEDIYGIMYPSVVASLEEEGANLAKRDHVLQDCWNLCCHFSAKEKANEEARQEEEEVRAKNKQDTLADIAQIVGVSAYDAQQYLALATHDERYYVYDEREGTYLGTPFRRSNLPEALAHYCPESAELKNEKGKPLSVRETTFRNSKPIISSIGYSNHIQKPKLETGWESRLWLPGARVRKDLRPRETARFRRWIEMLAGPYERYVLDWLAIAPSSTELLCALYLHGHPGVGKTLISHGLAAIYGKKPVDFGVADARFAAPLISCPIISISEGIDQNFFTQKDNTLALRTLFDADEREIELKGVSEHVPHRGKLRLTIAANDDDALRIRGQHDDSSIEAIIQRVGYVPPQPAEPIVEHLLRVERALGGMDRFIRHEIPENILYLAQHREVIRRPGYERYKHWDSPFETSLRMKLGASSTTAVAIALYMETLSTYDDISLGLLIDDGVIYVHSPTLASHWDTLMPSRADACPSMEKLYEALTAIRDKNHRWDTPSAAKKKDGKVLKMWPIDPEKILMAAQVRGIDTARWAHLLGEERGAA